MLGIVGKSGGGKTTLLKCIYGLEDLSGGEIFLDGERVLGPAYHLIPGHEQMKLVSQEFHVLEQHTVKENIFDRLIGYPNTTKEKRAASLMKLLELSPLQNTRAKYLSSGQKQRVAIARALAVIPRVLLLDEPFSNLDKLLSDKLFAFVIREVRKNRTSVILITHLAEEALKYADTIIVMDHGRVVETGKKWEVYYNPRNTRLAGLLGEFNLIRKEDLEKGSGLRLRSKLFLRPDRIRLCSPSARPDLRVQVSHCSYNGKCFEILGETRSGHGLTLYSAKALAPDKTYGFSILDTPAGL